MNAQEMLESYDALMALATELANRWTKSYGDPRYHSTGYSEAFDVRVDHAAGFIRFRRRSSPSGIDPETMMPIKYLNDSSTLEQDARAAYLKERDETSAIHEEIQRIKSSPDYQRLMQLEQQLNPFHYLRL